MKCRFLVLMVLAIIFIVPDEVSGWWGRRRRRCVPPDTTRIAYNNGWDGPFQFTCPIGKSVNGLHSKYSVCHKDRVFKFYCAKNAATANKAKCSWVGGYVNDFDQPVIFRCPNNGFITGIGSHHKNTAEDRRFRFRCCHSRHFIPYHCKSSGLINNWRSTFTYRLSREHFIVGVTSHHQNKHEDRRWHFTYCRVKYRWYLG